MTGTFRIERVARALYKRAPLSGTRNLPDKKIGLGPVAWEDVSKHAQHLFLGPGRAATPAMRALDGPMLDACAEICDGRLIALWGTVIDIALDEQDAG